MFKYLFLFNVVFFIKGNGLIGKPVKELDWLNTC